MCINSFCDLLGINNCLHQRFPSDLVLVDSNKICWCVWCGLQNGIDCLHTLQRGQITIICASCTSSLHMSKSRNTCVQRQAILVCQKILDHVGTDFISILIMGAFSDNDNCLSLTDFSVLVLLSIYSTILSLELT